MVVSIKFLGMQRTITKTDGIDMPITEKTSVNDVLDYITLQYPGLRLAEGGVTATVNQEVVPFDRILEANDTVSFLPYIGGG